MTSIYLRVADFKTYYRAIVIKTEQYWHEKWTRRPMEPNRKPRSKFMHLCPADFQRCKEYTI
jgi:hypothetical protein